MNFIKVFCGFISLSLCSCVSLRPISVSTPHAIDPYKYAYITNTNSISSDMGFVYGGLSLYGYSTSKSVNPGELIAGHLIKHGYTIIDTIQPATADKTLIINYGESGRRKVFWGYTIEVTIQFIDASTNEVICIVTGEGCGETETDDIRIAINRCFSEVFSKNK